MRLFKCPAFCDAWMALTLLRYYKLYCSDIVHCQGQDHNNKDSVSVKQYYHSAHNRVHYTQCHQTCEKDKQTIIMQCILIIM